MHGSTHVKTLWGNSVNTDARPPSPAPDAELILHAYHVWGTDCVQHLLGDFAFIVADTRQNRLFCARDQLGVKPLFFASDGDGLIVSNVLDCVRLHPEVSDKLNDSFVCDFLLFGWNTDVTATVFADIHRLAPAHSLEWSNNRLQIRRFWSITIPDEVHGRSHQEQVDGFMEVFEEAIEDRLRSDHVVVSMSGGLDSASLAATALPLLNRRSPHGELHAVTAVYDRIIPDRERYYAGMVAQHLGIPIDFVVGDDLEFFADTWDSPATQASEPSERGNLMDWHFRTRACKHSRIVLSGEGGDEAISPPRNYYQALLRELRVGRSGAGLLASYPDAAESSADGRADFALQAMACADAQQEEPKPQFPDWIHPDLVARFGLRRSLELVLEHAAISPARPWRPSGGEFLHAAASPGLVLSHRCNTTRRIPFPIPGSSRFGVLLVASADPHAVCETPATGCDAPANSRDNPQASQRRTGRRPTLSERSPLAYLMGSLCSAYTRTGSVSTELACPFQLGP